MRQDQGIAGHAVRGFVPFASVGTVVGEVVLAALGRIRGESAVEEEKNIIER